MTEPLGKLGRRSLLIGMGSLALTQVMVACLGRGRSPRFVVEFLASSVPASLLEKAEAELSATVSLKLTPMGQLSEGKLSQQVVARAAAAETDTANEPPSSLPNLTSLGDGWLAPAISSGSLQPLTAIEQPGWKQLPPIFQQLVTRDDRGFLNSRGQVWAAPYRWGQLMVAYRTDKLDDLGWQPTDWSDLWDEAIQRRLSLPDHDRLVLGLVLKSLGQSVNHTVLDAVDDLGDRLTALQQQVKVYSSDAYIQPLLLGDTWVAVGWSMDLLPLARRDRRINVMVPQSGTILSADLWVQPRTAPDPTTSDGPDQDTAALPIDQLTTAWIDFFWQPDIATQLSLLSTGAAPTLLTDTLELKPDLDLPPALTDDPLLIPPADILTRSEFIQPLPEDAIALYQRYWVEMRTASMNAVRS